MKKPNRMASKWLKYIWLINGIVILCMFTYSGIIKPFIKNNSNEYYEEYESLEDQGLISGVAVELARSQNEYLQGIRHSEPKSLTKSSGFFMTISAQTYKEAKQFEKAVSSANNMSFSLANCINILFLDSNHNPTHTLLDNLGYVMNYHIPSNYDHLKGDPTPNHILYEVATRDSNNDGLINTEDHRCLYISDVDGHNINNVTGQLHLVDYHFRNNYKEVFISYRDSVAAREEYKQNHYAIYDIKSNSLKKLTAIDQAINKLHAQLVVENSEL